MSRSPLLAFALSLTLFGGAGAWAEDPEELVFIVNAKNAVQRVRRTDLADYYLKRKRQWQNGSPVRFIDRNTASPERRRFVATILQQRESQVDLHWIGQKVYTGNRAPIQVSSETMVVEYVASFDGAIGYIRRATAATLRPNAGVKIIEVTP